MERGTVAIATAAILGAIVLATLALLIAAGGSGDRGAGVGERSVSVRVERGR